MEPDTCPESKYGDSHHWTPERVKNLRSNGEPVFRQVCRYCGLTYGEYLRAQDQ